VVGQSVGNSNLLLPPGRYAISVAMPLGLYAAVRSYRSTKGKNVVTEESPRKSATQV